MSISLLQTITVDNDLPLGNALERAFTDQGFLVNGVALELAQLPIVTVASERGTVDLGTAYVKDLLVLGPKDTVGYRQVCTRILECGHDLCLPSDPVRLCLQPPTLVSGTRLHAAMQSVQPADGPKQTFVIERGHSGFLQLYTDPITPELIFGPDSQVIFRLKSNPQPRR